MVKTVGKVGCGVWCAVMVAYVNEKTSVDFLCGIYRIKQKKYYSRIKKKMLLMKVMTRTCDVVYICVLILVRW